MMHWPANPFTHLGADLGDALSLKFTAAELLRMEVTYTQLVRIGMTEHTEQMFRFDSEEWAMLGKPHRGRAAGSLTEPRQPRVPPG